MLPDPPNSTRTIVPKAYALTLPSSEIELASRIDVALFQRPLFVAYRSDPQHCRSGRDGQGLRQRSSAGVNHRPGQGAGGATASEGPILALQAYGSRLMQLESGYFAVEE